MKIRVLDGYRLHTGFLLGTKALDRRKEKLNQMNLFPVPDGDRGSNLTATMERVSADSVFPFLSRVSICRVDAVFSGARGNSGLIFSQFFCGFDRPAGNADVIVAKPFGTAGASGTNPESQAHRYHRHPGRAVAAGRTLGRGNSLHRVPPG